MASKHIAVISNSLRGISPSFWPASDGKVHFERLCDYGWRDVWRHLKPNEDPPWRLVTQECSCPPEMRH
jgi:hypothetical protein